MRSLALLSAFLALSVASPLLPLLSSEMINFINKVNTTWTVSRSKQPTVAIRSPSDVNSAISTQAGQNFHHADSSYVKGLCGTFLKGPKLPQV